MPRGFLGLEVARGCIMKGHSSILFHQVLFLSCEGRLRICEVCKIAGMGNGGGSRLL